MQTCSVVVEITYLSIKIVLLFCNRVVSSTPVFNFTGCFILKKKKGTDKCCYNLDIFSCPTFLQPLVLLMEWPDASNFACLISGYYKLFVDPKRNIFLRAPGQSQLTKAGNTLHL